MRLRISHNDAAAKPRTQSHPPAPELQSLQREHGWHAALPTPPKLEQIAIAHGRLHPVLSLKASRDRTPSFGGSIPNCQLGNNLTPATLHSVASSFEPLIAHSTYGT